MIIISLFKWIAPLYDILMNFIGHGQTLEELVNRMEPSGGEKLLDLGGGTGQLLNFLPASMEVVLVDASDEMLSRARKNNNKQRVNYIQARGNNLPLEDNFFDYVVVVDALHHFNFIEDTIREIYRVLKPSGQLYILELNPDSFLTVFISRIEKLAGEPANFFYPEDLACLIEKEGFQASCEHISKSLYILTGEKRN